MARGEWTTQVARKLLEEFSQQGLDVLHDHGDKDSDLKGALGKLRSWFGPASTHETGLADLDLAIVARDKKKKVYALIEIEETTAKPKVILGDVFATLLGSGITFPGRGPLNVGIWTTLIVLVHKPQPSHKRRLAYLEQQVNQLKTHLSTRNASIGRIVLDTFQDETELKDKLERLIKEALEQVKPDSK